MIPKISFQQAQETRPQRTLGTLQHRLKQPTGIYIDVEDDLEDAQKELKGFISASREDVLNTLVGSWLEERGLVIVNGDLSKIIDSPIRREKKKELVNKNIRSKLEYWHFDHSIKIAEYARATCYSALWCPDEPITSLSGPATAFGEAGEVMAYICAQLGAILARSGQKPDLLKAFDTMGKELYDPEGIPAWVYKEMRERKIPIDYIDEDILHESLRESLQLPSVVSHVIKPGEIAFWSQQLLIHARLPVESGIKRINNLYGQDFYHELPFRGAGSARTFVA